MIARSEHVETKLVLQTAPHAVVRVHHAAQPNFGLAERVELVTAGLDGKLELFSGKAGRAASPGMTLSVLDPVTLKPQQAIQLDPTR